MDDSRHMTTLLYLHGLKSSPNSKKARLTKEWFAHRAPTVDFLCPAIPPFAHAAMDMLENEIAPLEGRTVHLVGSSMGGFFATCLIEKYDLRGVLVNPAVDPANGMEYLLGKNKNFQGTDFWTLEPRHIEEYRDNAHEKIKNKSNYLVLLQSGDEVLDYRDAIEYYAGCSTIIEQGGNHSFTNYQYYLDEIYQFLFEE